MMKYKIGLENAYGSVALQVVDGKWEMGLDCCISPNTKIEVSSRVAEELINASSNKCFEENLEDCSLGDYEVVSLSQDKFELTTFSWDVEMEDYVTELVFEATGKYDFIRKLLREFEEK